jgi:putative MATE family efflux protein
VSKLISYRNIWKVSLPIIFSGVAQNIVNVTDTAFLGRVGMVELGAAGNAGIFYFVLMVVGMGFTIGCQIIIGRRNGEENFSSIGKYFQTALFFLLPLATVLFLLLYFLSPLLLKKLTASTAILEAALAYLKIRSFGIFFAYLNYLFVAFYTGIIRTRVLTYATFLQATVNVIFDFLLIFGIAGFPQMGIEGAALASVFSEISALVYFLLYTWLKTDRAKYQLNLKLSFSGKAFRKMLKIGFPVMFQNFMALSSWLAFFMIIEQIGEKELAVSHIVRSIYMVLMIPLFGFSAATSTLVSNSIGKGLQSSVLLLVKRIMLLSLLCTLAFLPLLIIIPRSIISIYTNDPFLIEASLPVLKVITGSMLFFSLAYIAFSSVTGTGKTQVSMAIELSSIFIYLIGAYWIGVHQQLSLPWVWCSEFIYFTIMGSISILYLKFGNWRSSSL